MNISFSDKRLVIDSNEIEMAWPIIDAFEIGGKIIVLFDPDSYLIDSEYKASRRKGAEAIRNLCAYSKVGKKLWCAEFPESADYYYKISSKNPLCVYSFSSFKCEINPDTGKIKQKIFLK